MFRPVLVLAGMMMIALPAHAQRQAIWESWGKPGVSFDRYRADGIECARSGVGIDIAETRPVKDLRRSSSEMEGVDKGAATYSAGATPAELMDQTVLLANQYQRVREAARAEQRVAEVKGLMMTTVDACLTARGYRKFRLTKAQHDRLGHMRIGKPERHQYLYGLASDPEVLDRQALPQ